ncbi:hypothetical protein K8R32_00115 [bacterium]|nr:hypothetical protein [bacterium]
MIKKIIKFVHSLRVLFLSFIIVFFLFLLGLNPVDIGRFLGASFGSAVGMSVGVVENPFNKLALQLKEKEDNLFERELGLIEREQALIEERSGKQERLLLFIAIGIIFLFFLILFNFYFDYKRGLYKKDR